jgi:exonuclease VII small subunit
MNKDSYTLSLESRLTAVETKVSELETGQTDLEKRMIEISLDLKYLRAAQDSLSSNLNKFLWVVGGGFLAAVVGFVVRGGLII